MWTRQHPYQVASSSLFSLLQDKDFDFIEAEANRKKSIWSQVYLAELSQWCSNSFLNGMLLVFGAGHLSLDQPILCI